MVDAEQIDFENICDGGCSPSPDYKTQRERIQCNEQCYNYQYIPNSYINDDVPSLIHDMWDVDDRNLDVRVDDKCNFLGVSYQGNEIYDGDYIIRENGSYRVVSKHIFEENFYEILGKKIY